MLSHDNGLIRHVVFSRKESTQHVEGVFKRCSSFLCFRAYNNNTIVIYDNAAADVIYGKPYCRIPAYLVGMVFGYIFYKVQGQPFQMNKVQQEDCKSV